MKRYNYNEFVRHFLPGKWLELLQPKTPEEVGKAIAKEAIKKLRKALRKR